MKIFINTNRTLRKRVSVCASESVRDKTFGGLRNFKLRIKEVLEFSLSLRAPAHEKRALNGGKYRFLSTSCLLCMCICRTFTLLRKLCAAYTFHHLHTQRGCEYLKRFLLLFRTKHRANVIKFPLSLALSLFSLLSAVRENVYAEEGKQQAAAKI